MSFFLDILTGVSQEAGSSQPLGRSAVHGHGREHLRSVGVLYQKAKESFAR